MPKFGAVIYGYRQKGVQFNAEIYLKAESLKFKRSCLENSVLVIPAFSFDIHDLSVYWDWLGGFQAPWSAIGVCRLLLSIVVLCHLVNHKDQKQLPYSLQPAH